MSNLHVKHLLVGGGIASLSAARAIRSVDGEGAVLMIGQEPSRPYHRSPLSKQYLRRRMTREELFAAGPDWFLRSHVELRTGRRVSRLDVARQTAVLDNGEEVSFDHLLLATGATPTPLSVPGARLPNVLYLRSVEDVVLLHNAVDQARLEGRPHPVGSARRGRGKAVVIGGGLLGVEAAASIQALGLWVDLLVEKSHPWDLFAGEATGRFMQMYLARNGIAVHNDCPVRQIEGDGRVQRVVVSDALTIDCDFVVGCLGTVPSKDLTRGTPIAVGKAIVVDEQCRTNVAGVWAAGDCCALLDPRFGKHRQIEHAGEAAETGALAGRNMAGAAEAYSAVNHFTSEVFDLSLHGWGEPRLIDRRVIRGSMGLDAFEFIEVGVAADGRIAQVLSVGHSNAPVELEVLQQLVAQRVALNGNEERLKDPSYPLANLLD